MNALLQDWAVQALAWSLVIAMFGAAAVLWLRRRRSSQSRLRRAGPSASPASDLLILRTLNHAERLRLDAFFEQWPHPAWLRAPDLRLMRVNAAFAQAVGAPDALTAVVRGLELAPADFGAAERRLAASVQRTGVEQTESVSVVANGVRLLYQLTERPAGDGWIAGIAHDMSAVDALQTDLLTHMEAHQEVLEHLQAGVAVFDGARRLRFVNRAYADLWGLDYRWLAGCPCMDEMLEILRQKRRLPEVTDFAEFRRRMERRFHTLLEPEEQLLHLPDGRCFREVAAPHPLGGLLFILEDVTDRLALERNYNTLIVVQRGILDQLADGVAAFGNDGRVTVFNPAFLRLLGFASSGFGTGVHIADLLDRLGLLADQSDDWERFREGAVFAVTGRETMAHRLTLADGRVLDIACAPLSDGSVLMRVRDFTDTFNVERVLLERNAALEEANRLKTDFLANASYELRTPLTTISGFTELLQSGIGGPLTPVQREYLTGIMAASGALGALIDSVLDVSLGEAGQWDAGVGDVALAPMIHSVAAVVRPQMEAQGLMLNIFTAPALPTIQADERRLRQLLFNLMSSAARHNRGAASVDLTCHADQDAIEIGVGMPPQGHRPDRHIIDNELGLTLVQRLAVLHGGSMAIERRGVAGARIVCRLPLQRAMQEPPPPPYAPAVFRLTVQ